MTDETKLILSVCGARVMRTILGIFYYLITLMLVSGLLARLPEPLLNLLRALPLFLAVLCQIGISALVFWMFVALTRWAFWTHRPDFSEFR